MSAKRISGVLTWILGLLTLIAVLNVFNALIQLNLYGGNAVTAFRIFNTTLGSMNAEYYFWLSVITAFALFSAASFSIYRGMPVDPQVTQRIGKVEENLATNSNMLENTQIGFFRKLEDNEKRADETFQKITQNITDTRKELAENLDAQRKTLESLEKETGKSADSVKKQTTELTKIKKTVDEINENKGKIEKPKLNGQTKLEDFRNVPPALAAKLSVARITNVSELLAADSMSIAEKTGQPPETIAHLQAEAQLLMVPGIDEKHSELLVKFGVTSRRELANQDPVQLYRGLNGIAKSYVDQGKMSSAKVPTIEDVSQWIKQAQL